MYNEILKLAKMLSAEGIPYELEPSMDGYHIIYSENSHIVCSVIEHMYSYGSNQDKLEIMGLLTDEESECDEVVGSLTANDVFCRIFLHRRGYWGGDSEID